MVKKVKGSSEKAGEKDTFKWSDDEAELLLKVTHDYKVFKAAEGVDWESVQSKYSDICKRMVDELPETPDEAKELNKDYPHKKNELTKQVVTTKLKAIRTKYRQAVDSGRISGHGRVVFMYFDLCESIWGGSPATEQIPSGFESIESEGDTGSGTTSSTETVTSLNTSVEDDQPVSKETDCSENSDDGAHKGRRELLSARLTGYKQEKLKRKIPVDAQMLSCAKEDLQLKKRMIEHMDKMDSQHDESMKKLSSNMEKLTHCIADGFSLLQGLLYSPPPSTYNPPPSTYNPYAAAGYPPPPPQQHGIVLNNGCYTDLPRDHSTTE